MVQKTQGSVKKHSLDPDSDFWPDPDSMNMDPSKHWSLVLEEAGWAMYREVLEEEMRPSRTFFGPITMGPILVNSGQHED